MLRKLMVLTIAALLLTTALPFSAMAADETTATPVVETAVAVEDLAASSPYDPAQNNGEWQTIEPGDYHLYAFHISAYDASDDADQSYADAVNRVNIRLYTEGSGEVELLLLNAEQVADWQQDGTLAYFGAATELYMPTYNVDDDEDTDTEDTDTEDTDSDDADSEESDGFVNLGYAAWSSRMDNSGDYYILIHNDANAAGSSSYQFSISGSSVTMR